MDLTLAGLLVPAAISTAVCAAMIVPGRSSRHARLSTASGRMEPLPPPEAGWSHAPVYRTPLLLRYQEPGDQPTETVVEPRSIAGRRAHSRGVRPDAINAFCRTGQVMRVFRYDSIVWAADARSGEFIQDLYNYLGGAQPGGAPAPLYRKTNTPDSLTPSPAGGRGPG